MNGVEVDFIFSAPMADRPVSFSTSKIRATHDNPMPFQFVFESDETIRRITVNRGALIDGLTIVTNRRSITAGGTGGEPFTVSIL
jgi:hypothetical protein